MPDAGNVLELNGTPLAAPYLSVMTFGSSVSSSESGQQVILTAMIQAANPGDGSPTVSVDFMDATTGTDLGTVQVTNGTATLMISTLAVGSHTITAKYSGDNNFSLSLGSVPLTVNPLSLTVSSSGLVYSRATQLFGGTITLTNTTTAAITGILEVVLTGLPAGVTLANASGTDGNGNPYILVNLTNGALAAGQSISFTVLFSNPKKMSFQYGTSIFDTISTT